MGRYDSTVKVPVIVREGRLEFFHAEHRSVLRAALREGAIGEVVLPADAVQDARWLEALNARGTHELFPAGYVLWIRLDLRSEKRGSQNGGVGVGKAQSAEHFWFNRHLEPAPSFGEVWTSVELQTPLLLQLRGEKKARLQGGQCAVPVLDSLQEPAQAISLNQACTWLSQAFETWRQSHSGNAFERVYVAQSTPQLLLNGREQMTLIPLERWRDHETAQHKSQRLRPADALPGGNVKLLFPQ